MTTDTFDEHIKRMTRALAIELQIPEHMLMQPIPELPDSLAAVSMKMNEIHRYTMAASVGTMIFNHWLTEAILSGAITVSFKELNIKPEYTKLEDVLARAYIQAASGKGAERHEMSSGLPFENQRMQRIAQLVDSPMGMVHQVIKKITEGIELPTHEAQIKELLGAINYVVGTIVFLEKQHVDKHSELEEDDAPRFKPAPPPKISGPTRVNAVDKLTEFKARFGVDAVRAVIRLAGYEKIMDIPAGEFLVLDNIITLCNVMLAPIEGAGE